jgi:AcrR family transcriptional regulator
VPRSAAANQRIRDGQRARLLAAARQVVARRGLAATMAEVAGAAGVSQGLAYRYFAGKDELFRAMLRDSIAGAPAAGTEPAGTPGERLAALITALLARRRDEPELFQLLHHVMADPDAPPDLLALVERRGRQFAAGVRGLVVAGQASGEVVPGHPDQLVTALMACLEGLSRPGPGGGHFPDPAVVLRLVLVP